MFKYFELVMSKFRLQNFLVWKNGTKSAANAVYLIGDVEPPHRCADRQKYCTNRTNLLRSTTKLHGIWMPFSKLRTTLQEWQADRLIAAITSGRRLPHHQRYGVLQSPHLPMRRHIAKPLNARGLEPHIGSKPTSHGAMNDGLPLLLSITFINRIHSGSFLRY